MLILTCYPPISPALQMVVRIGGKEESGQLTITNEEKDGGRAEGKPMRDCGREGGIEEEEA